MLSHFLRRVEDTKGVVRIRKSKKGHTTQWPKEKGQMYKQRSTKHSHKLKIENGMCDYVNKTATSILSVC
jgi:hypothetical protein